MMLPQSHPDPSITPNEKLIYQSNNDYVVKSEKQQIDPDEAIQIDGTATLLYYLSILSRHIFLFFLYSNPGGENKKTVKALLLLHMLSLFTHVGKI